MKVYRLPLFLISAGLFPQLAGEKSYSQSNLANLK
jgi:hypothetical protein